MSRAPLLVHWGRSPYESDSALDLRRRVALDLGLRFRAEPLAAPASQVADAQVLVVSSLRPVDASALRAAAACRLLLSTTSGYEHLDLRAARSRGVVVGRMPLARRDAVVEASLAMGLSLLRDLPALHEQARAGRWLRPLLPGRGIGLLRGEPVGLVGLGVIGARMAQVLGALGARVLGCDPAGLPPQVEPASLDDLLGSCRLVSLHCSHRRGAPPLLDAARLARARPDTLLVNTARGALLDLQAAEHALASGRLGGLGLDVFPQEPWPWLARLASHPRTLLGPHAAGFYEGLDAAIARELRSALEAWQAGEEIPHRVA